MTVANTANRTGVADTASSTAILAALAAGGSRKGVIIHNNSSEILYIAYGGTAAAISSAGYTYKIPADAHWEMPEPIFSGALWGIWANNSSGYAAITELT